MTAAPVAELVSQSIQLDVALARTPQPKVLSRLQLVAVKYGLLAKHSRKPFSLGIDSARVAGRRIFYDSRFGIAGLQRALVSHQAAFRTAGIADVFTVVDIGANVGYFTLVARMLFPKARIFAVEPVPDVYACLVKNVEGDSGITPLNFAVSDTSGPCFMTFDPANSALGMLDPDGGIPVDVRTLDSLAEELGLDVVDVLKIDTETFESHVLRGGRQTLAKTRYLFCEITMKDNPHYTASSLLSLLSSEEFDFQLLTLRNFSSAKRPIEVLDCVFVNRMLAAPR